MYFWIKQDQSGSRKSFECAHPLVCRVRLVPDPVQLVQCTLSGTQIRGALGRLGQIRLHLCHPWCQCGQPTLDHLDSVPGLRHLSPVAFLRRVTEFLAIVNVFDHDLLIDWYPKV